MCLTLNARTPLFSNSLSRYFTSILKRFLAENINLLKVFLCSGVSTGSVYKDVALLRNGFPAESVNNGSVIAVKTHEWGQDVRGRFQAALLLLR